MIEKIVNHHRQHGGISRVEKIRYAHTALIGKPLSRKGFASWGERSSRLVVGKVIEAAWIKGAKEFLKTDRKGLPVFVISGTPENEFQTILELRKMTDIFSAILGSPVKKLFTSIIFSVIFSYSQKTASLLAMP